MNTQILESISAKQKESLRLTNTLRYYDWLESQGLDWSTIRGVLKLKGEPKHWRAIPKQYHTGNKPSQWKGYVLSVKLITEEVEYRHYPPYDDNVVFNRPCY